MTMLVDEPTPVAAGSRREEVLGLLRGSERALSAAEVAAAIGLHLNTARFHLDGLVDDGLVERVSEPREQPGRPRILYSSRGPVPGPRSYALLAEMLTGLVASLEDAGPAAVDAGRAWGRHLVERPAPSESIDDAEAIDRLNQVLEAVGFQPELRTTGSGTEICLHHCPFREVAERHTDVVCAIHLGLMQGALAELGASVSATELEPFVEPNLCVAHLTSPKPASDRGRRGQRPVSAGSSRTRRTPKSAADVRGAKS
ncbi:MAG TPA: helix-turn-helix domain-containing protein [Mycobacteriales bacterium]|jgi:predicted ArsR family transcriptional regulator|nr:helix-turn-helix domain-containing protein [Mycobacteriales bacterium]HVX69071.1 helix-turn-helix domain-containing protein [Mycobacteriales bacterium]